MGKPGFHRRLQIVRLLHALTIETDRFRDPGEIRIFQVGISVQFAFGFNTAILATMINLAANLF
jgi:hypothetical protein